MNANHLSSAMLQPALPEGDAASAVPIDLERPSAPAKEPVQLHVVESPALQPLPAEEAPSRALPMRHDGLRHEAWREMRRADRSHAPLSVAVYNVGLLDATPDRSTGRLEAVLQGCKREVDILCEIGEGAFAMLLPNTGKDGAQRFVRKVAEQLEGLPVLTRSASYPGVAFDRLIDEAALEAGLPLHTDARPAEAQEAGYALKRSIDVAGAACALLLLSPLMLLTAAAIVATSPGPAIYKQQRLGRNGVPFTFYKFRSMVTNGGDEIHRRYVASLIKGELPAADKPAGGTRYKMTADKRITFVGKYIRRFSIDEVPQFYNVLKGDMSLVGPRPPLPYETANYQSWHLRRVQHVKPGITGIWQVEGRSKVSFDEMVRMDLRYVRQCSLWLDLKIALRTVIVVLRGDGAA